MIVASLMLGIPAIAQEEQKGVKLHGTLQTDILVPQDDNKIGTEHTSDKVQTNTYLDLGLTSKYVDAGARFEYLEHPLPGFETDFKGWGVPHVYVKGKLKKAELTLGDFYEQFGSGLILRAYEERALGIDNSIRGARAKVSAINGVRLTALGGVQRRYWDWSTDSWLAGADAELDINQFIHAFAEKNINWTLGGSWVLKNEKKPEGTPVFVPGTSYKLQVPSNVNAFDVRSQLNLQNFSLLTEAAFKSEDPSHDNGYTFHRGNAILVSASYSKKGFSALAQAKRSQDMSFRSQRAMTGISAFVNNMPAFAYQHTYALAALYPYATKYADISENGATLVPGEWAFQGEVAYNFKRNTTLGGKYGTKVKANFTQVRGLDAKPASAVVLPDGSESAYTYGGKGYSASFFGMTGEKYYQDLNLQIEKKFTKQFKLNLMYMNQVYNQPVIESHGNMMKNNIIIADGRYQFNNKVTLRMEYQHLFAKQDKDLAEKEQAGDWDYALAELTVLPHLMFTVSDMYGKPYFADGYHKKQHYYLGSVTYTHGAHRVNLGYGRTRAGFNCSGGVCRWVPASKGVQVGYNYTF